MRVEPRWWPLLLGLAYLLVVLHGLGDADIVGDDESREVAIAQDVARGHVLWPTFNDELLPDKPTLYHWLAGASVAVLGFSEVTVRLPSALSAAGLVWWTAAYGNRLLGHPAGLVAAGLLATMPALFSRARVARPDALLALLLAIGLGLAYDWWRDRRPRDATMALVCIGLAVLNKGPVAPVIFGIAFGLFLLWQRDLRRAWRFLTPSGVAAFLVLGLGWYVLAYAGWGQRFVDEHLIGRYVRNLAGGMASGGAYSPKSFWYHATFYPLHLWAIVLPWTPFLLLALWRIGQRSGLRDPRARFLLCWAVAPVIAFTPAEWKLRYYLLPSLPALALLTAPTVTSLLLTPLREIVVTGRSLFAAAVMVLVVVGTAALVLQRPDLLARSDRSTVEAFMAALGGPSRIAMLIGLLSGVVAVAVAAQAWGAIAALIAAASLLWLVLVAPQIEAETSRRDSVKPFGLAVKEHIAADQPLAFYGPPVRAVVVYAERNIPSLHRQPDRITLGMGVIAFAPAHQALVNTGYVGPALATGSGRIGNITRGELVLAEALTRTEP
ncbi:MAG TPA: glycosyltransferase family 39 protein [Candidatus Binatia bacterium]|jgi:4-amino-4-deoxy-L-arabinose transferase-like glycosyltransferase|nr:glycosyltransferase family 39 protein [Candidatus Binatia bacterium]